MRPAEKIPGVLASFAELAAEVIAEEGCLPTPQAIAVGRRVAERISRDYAGQQFYIPSCYALRVAERDEEIAQAAASGEPRDETISRLSLTLSSYYAAIRRFNAAERDRRQTKLFPSNDDEDGGS